MHTPGPWKYNERLCSISGSDGWKIAHIYDYQGNSEANARLIAAAPEMYEALQKIANPISFMQKEADELEATLDSITTIALFNDPSYLREIAKTVLAKTQGDTP